MALASREGWLVDEWEFRFVLSRFPEGCFRVCHAGEPIGFVTSLRHERSGWIGNLIVAPPFRGQGVGRELFAAARSILEKLKVETIWLTASNDGLPLYRSLGFRRCDTIIRWRGLGRHRHDDHAQGTAPPGLHRNSLELDRLAWGDRRDELLSAVAGRGMLFEDQDGFLVLQPMGDGHLIGPFAAASGGTAGRLLYGALEAVGRNDSVCLDMPASNRDGVRLLRRKGFAMTGRTELMYAGNAPAYRPELLYGLATAGSCG